jgi:biopolymer transport protein ExbD
MAMDLGGAKGGIKSDINVTPLVDVMLVLLIIMMLVTPLIQQGVSVRLPVAQNTSDKPDTQEQTLVTIARDKAVYLNAKLISKDDLSKRVTEALESRKEKIVLIKADEEVEYSAVMDAMDQLRKAGIEDIGLVTANKKAPAGPTAGGGK